MPRRQNQYYRLSKLVPESIPQSSRASTSSEGVKPCLNEASSAEFCAKLNLQKISGHRSLQALQKYLEVSEEQVERAIASLSF